ncbi:hypothetical protein AGMMS50268_40180 [Spirochaetia bacterium]|nr:hypothetical protein AGMMS50268_40180 [Spirochaetia bacterium]
MRNVLIEEFQNLATPNNSQGTYYSYRYDFGEYLPPRFYRKSNLELWLAQNAAQKKEG